MDLSEGGEHTRSGITQILGVWSRGLMLRTRENHLAITFRAIFLLSTECLRSSDARMRVERYTAGYYDKDSHRITG